MKKTVRFEKGLTGIILSVELYEEGGYQIAYSPDLDLVGQGKNEQEAIQDLQETIQLTFDWSLEHGKLHEMLLDHGWTVRKFPDPMFEPPHFRTGEMKSRPGYRVKEIPVYE